MRLHTLLIGPLAAATLLLSACATGPGVERYRPAVSPNGVIATIRIGDDTHVGELLEVRDSTVLVLLPTEIARIPFRAMRNLTIRDERLPYRGGTPYPAVRERLRLLSRFPAGVPPEYLARLLQARGQQDVRSIPP